MIKQSFSIVMALFVAFGFTPIPAEAGIFHVPAGMAGKLARGVIDVSTGFVELPAQAYKGLAHGIDGINLDLVSHPAGAALGSVRGVHHSLGRTLSGVFDIGGFWAADYKYREGYGESLDAPYAWQAGEAHLGPIEVLTSIPHKGIRGLENLTLGAADLPSQSIKSVRSSKSAVGLVANPPVGVVKGSWFGVSRIYNGMQDVATFYLPHRKDAVAATLEEDHPWSGAVGI